jgi:hypothetical protein
MEGSDEDGEGDVESFGLQPDWQQQLGVALGEEVLRSGGVLKRSWGV